MNIQKFILDYNVIGYSVGSIIGFGFTNWAKELRQTIVQPFIIDKLGIHRMGSFISATIEVIVLLVLIFMLYQYIVRPAIGTSLKRKEEQNKIEEQWKNSIIHNMNYISEQVKEINDTKYML